LTMRLQNPTWHHVMRSVVGIRGRPILVAGQRG